MITQIEPGQKLQDGDCFTNGTVQQYQELFSMDNLKYPVKATLQQAENCFEHYYGVAFMEHQNYLVYLSVTPTNDQYSFEAFKQLCENTFGDEN